VKHSAWQSLRNDIVGRSQELGLYGTHAIMVETARGVA
jgi:hypothetical protein